MNEDTKEKAEKLVAKMTKTYHQMAEQAVPYTIGNQVLALAAAGEVTLDKLIAALEADIGSDSGKLDLRRLAAQKARDALLTARASG